VAITETVAIDARSSTQPFPHFWEKVFGSGRAILTLRESYRQDLRAVKAITDFEYVRFHAIFHDEVGFYDEDRHGRPVYNFSYIDQIYDGLLELGIRPFVELSFMPLKLASKRITHHFWYKPIIASPKSWSRWEALIFKFTKHLVDRYGIKEVTNWYFEVWNEPNLDFWSGKPKQSTYYELYDHAAHAIKRVNGNLRVGGPATAQSAWVDRFIKHCFEKRVPIDFVSTHIYANDKAKDVFGSKEIIPRNEMVARAIGKVKDQVTSSRLPNLPIHWTEYNASYKNEVSVTDSPFMGPWLADNILKCDGLVTTLAYWTFSDIFEERGVVRQPFYGGFGLIAAGHIPKASYNAFKLLHMLGTDRIKLKSSSTIATRRVDGSLAIAIWNYAPPNKAGSHRRVKLVLKGLTGLNAIRIHLLHHHNGSPLARWKSMGSPQSPTSEQQLELRAAGELNPPELRPLTGENAATIIHLPPHSLALIETIQIT